MTWSKFGIRELMAFDETGVLDCSAIALTLLKEASIWDRDDLSSFNHTEPIEGMEMFRMKTTGDKQVLLSPAQRRIVAAGLTAAALVVLALTLFQVLGLLRDGIVMFANVIWPLATAIILTILLRPIVSWMEAKTRWSRTRCVSILFLLVGMIGLVLAALVIPLAINQTVQAFRALPETYDNVVRFLSERFPDLVGTLELKLGAENVSALGNELVALVRKLSASSVPMIQAAGGQVLGFLQTATLLGIIPVYLFYFMLGEYRVYDRMGQQLDFLKDKWREDLLTLVQDFVRYVVAFFRGQILVAGATGLMLAFGFTFIGLQFGFLFGLLFGALNIIPYLGTIIGLATVLPVAFFQPDGGGLLVVFVLAVFSVVQTLESNIVSPRIMGKETGLHPVVIIVAIFFWGIALNGIVGMILAVPLTAFLFSAWDLLRRRYLSQTDLFGKVFDGESTGETTPDETDEGV